MTKRSGERKSKRPPRRPRLDPDEFPCLRAFVRGYLHEDFVEVHGSPLRAAAAFCADASAEEQQRFDREIEVLVDATEGRSPRVLRRFLTESLGGSWAPRSTDELRALRAAIPGARSETS